MLYSIQEFLEMRRVENEELGNPPSEDLVVGGLELIQEVEELDGYILLEEESGVQPL